MNATTSAAAYGPLAGADPRPNWRRRVSRTATRGTQRFSNVTSAHPSFRSRGDGRAARLPTMP